MGMLQGTDAIAMDASNASRAPTRRQVPSRPAPAAIRTGTAAGIAATVLALGVLALGVRALGILAPPAQALEPAPGEEAAIKTCEQRLCTMALGRKPTGDDLKCDLAKTWDRDTLKKGESSSVKWGFGDARCEVDLDISRTDVVAALTEKKHVVAIPEHTVACTVEREDGAQPVTVKLAPKLAFKNGKADKIWINLIDIDGPQAITATVWMAAKLEDNLGIFHKGMIKSVNKFLHKKCGERYYADGRAKPETKGKDKAGAGGATKTAATPAKPASPAAKSADPKTAAVKKPPAETGTTPSPAKVTAPAAKPSAPVAADNR